MATAGAFCGPIKIAGPESTVFLKIGISGIYLSDHKDRQRVVRALNLDHAVKKVSYIVEIGFVFECVGISKLWRGL